MSDIVRIDTNQRMSRVVKAAGLVFIGGQTSADPTPDVKVQTAKVLEKIDGFLEKAGIDKTRHVMIGVLDHQVHIQWQFGLSTHKTDDGWPEGNVIDEVAIHDVSMDPVRARSFHFVDFVSQL